jgi:1,2-diacylglycerol 3-alpha-glucosyltransferase
MYEDYTHYITKGYFDKSSKKIVEYITNFYCDKTCSELIVPTKKTYELFKDKYKYKRDIHIIPTGLEIERFYKSNLNKTKIKKIKENFSINDNDFIILFVGRMGIEKNVDFLIDAHKRIVKKYPHAKLMLVGSGPDEEKFKNRVKKLKLEDSVIFTGKVPYEDVPNYYGCSDIFVTASTTETQGLTVIEAMAASLPVLCINDESFNQVVVNDLNGYLFESKIGLYNAVDKIIDNEEKIKELSVGARNTAKMHSSKYYAERVLDVYEVALSKKKVTYKTKINRILKRGKLYGKNNNRKS